MGIIRKINDEFAIAETIALEQWEQIAEEGFRSVLNLQLPGTARLSIERQYVESLGLQYVNLPIDIEIEAMTVETALRILRQIDDLPKPMVVFNHETVAAAMVLMHIAMRQGETLQQAFQRAEKTGLFRIPIQQFATQSAI